MKLLQRRGNVNEVHVKKSRLLPGLFTEGFVPARASSFCSSLLALTWNEDVLSLFSLFAAEWDPGCCTLNSGVARGPFLLEPCRNERVVNRAGQGKVDSAPQKTAAQSLCSSVNMEQRRVCSRGSSSLLNLIEWFSVKQRDNSHRCTLQHLLTGFWMDLSRRNKGADGTDRAISENRVSSQSDRSVATQLPRFTSGGQVRDEETEFKHC